ncbi:hypothetical protein IB286_07170 [Spongiibacter sp. KMU-158]|uniref:Uncharacterized protein n=1 Tax=Spongiibacter pelagi TaxID=2760804 RepID=A0A927C132_9GAMM|nr:hypothetical protein [Spongiibacter pelagi]MBD2858789.1 hypothetical protein [Spongiibacter pelagi]
MNVARKLVTLSLLVCFIALFTAYAKGAAWDEVKSYLYQHYSNDKLNFIGAMLAAFILCSGPWGIAFIKAKHRRFWPGAITFSLIAILITGYSYIEITRTENIGTTPVLMLCLFLLWLASLLSLIKISALDKPIENTD